MFVILFLFIIRPHPRSTLFPYTTLFRSCLESLAAAEAAQGKAARAARLWGASDGLLESVGSALPPSIKLRSEEHTSELQSLRHLVCRLLLEKKKKKRHKATHPIGNSPLN